jgi:hypothetical protein
MREYSGQATIVFHSAVFGRSTQQVRWFQVSEVEPRAQDERSVTVRFLEPRKRRRCYTTLQASDYSRYLTIEVNGATVYDSRQDVPIDMGKWNEAAARFTQPALAEAARPPQPTTAQGQAVAPTVGQDRMATVRPVFQVVTLPEPPKPYRPREEFIDLFAALDGGEGGASRGSIE